MKKHLALIVAAFGSATLFSGCMSTQQLTAAAPYVEAGNTAGAQLAGAVDPAIAIPAGLFAGILNGFWGAVSTATVAPGVH